MTFSQGLKLWTVHVLESERTTRGFKRLFITYDQLMQRPVETVASLAEKLGLWRDSDAAVVSGRIDPTLRHHKEPSWPDGEPYKDLTLAIHQTLASDEPEKEEKLDRLRDEYYRHMQWSC